MQEKKSRRPPPAFTLTLIAAALTASLSLGCAKNGAGGNFQNIDYYLDLPRERRAETRQFLTELHNNQGDYEYSYVLLNQIIRRLHSAGQTDKLNLLLTTYVETHPQDPFNASYLLIVANNYLGEEAYPFARYYFEQILNNHNDLLIQDYSVHYLCLTNLTRLTDDPYLRAEYYRELLSRFGEGSPASEVMAVNMGSGYYQLALTYEELGEWELAYQAYRNFLQYPNTEIPGRSGVHRMVAEKVAFHDYRNKNWLYDNVETLKEEIRSAVYSKSAPRLRSLAARVNFFTQYWEQESPITDKEVTEFLASLDLFMIRRVIIQENLDPSSNSQEAYLESRGWDYRIPTWYLYFNRVSYPADPEINGRWQWAGIYFGEKPFSGSPR
jgi:tetratricopeptide (TPR) repeat protein